MPRNLNTSELSVYDLQKHQKYQFRPGSIVYPSQSVDAQKIGTVLDSYPEGFVHVHWMDATETKSWPQDLFLLPEVEYDIITDTSTDFAPGSWETESVESVEGDNLLDEKTLALMASKLDYVRSKMIYLKEMFKMYQKSSVDSLAVILTLNYYLYNIKRNIFFSAAYA